MMNINNHLNNEVASFKCWMQNKMIGNSAGTGERQNMTVLAHTTVCHAYIITNCFALQYRCLAYRY